MKRSISTVICAVVFSMAFVLISTAAFATNGMNLEGYGPIATGMGGASMAYDNGTAAMMNNPATMGLMPDGNRLDVAFGYLGPHVKAEAGGMSASSSADAFFMPAIGWVKKTGKMTFGAGVYSQGGMGTEYGADSFLAMMSGDKVRSELGVGRAIIPFVYNVTPEFTIGATLDYVWASLDLKMALPGSDMAGLVTNCTGGGCAALGPLAGTPVTRLDFSGGGDFSGAATGNGYAGKIGATYKISPTVSIGATYHSKTSLSDLETESNGAILSAGNFGAVGPVSTGKIKVRDFQWPETYAVGVAWKATKALLVVFDIKQINWKDVMKDFKMTYEGSFGLAGAAAIDFAMPQNWDNQTVYELGVGYNVNAQLTLRAGINISDNPIPNDYLNYLFPAIIKEHYTIGAGYMIGKASSVDASFTYAPEVTQTSGATGITSKHYQTSAQVMYSYRF